MSVHHHAQYSQQRRKLNGSHASLDGFARSTMSLDVPEARTCRETREQGRKEMHFLNEKLAAQLDKIRILSEQNKKLMDESSGTRDRIRETEKIRQTYNTELRQLRQLVDDCEREKADSLAKMATLHQTVRAKQDQTQHLTQANQRLSDQLDQALKDAAAKDADKVLLQRHIKSAEDELQRLRSALDQSKQNNQQLHTNLDEETASRMACQSEMQTMREEMEFLRTVHEQELDELRALVNGDQEQDREQWREEMQRAIRDIQNEYDQRLDKIRGEMENSYTNRLTELSKTNAALSAQLQQLIDENNLLKNNLENMRKRAEQSRIKADRLEEAFNESQEECRNLRSKLDSALKDAEREREAAEEALNKALAELLSLTDAKLNLESEIAAYRRLLEAQEFLFSSVSDGGRSRDASPALRPKELRVRVPSYTTTSQRRTVKNDMVNQWIDREEPSGQSARSHIMERTVEGSQQLSCSYSDSDKVNTSQTEHFSSCQLAITDCPANGHYVEIANTGKTEAKVAGWYLIRNIDNGRRMTRFTFPYCKIEPHSSLRIWAAGKIGPGAGPNDIEAPYSTWGIGSIIHTSLYSPDGLEKAAHTQKLDYGS